VQIACERLSLTGIESVKKNIALSDKYKMRTVENGKHFNLKVVNGGMISIRVLLIEDVSYPFSL
jgi:hypothetical protein